MFSRAVELQNRLSEESKKADKLDYECKRLKEKVDSLQKEKDVSAKVVGFFFFGSSESNFVSFITERCHKQPF